MRIGREEERKAPGGQRRDREGWGRGREGRVEGEFKSTP